MKKSNILRKSKKIKKHICHSKKREQLFNQINRSAFKISTNDKTQKLEENLNLKYFRTGQSNLKKTRETKNKCLKKIKDEHLREQKKDLNCLQPLLKKSPIHLKFEKPDPDSNRKCLFVSDLDEKFNNIHWLSTDNQSLLSIEGIFFYLTKKNLQKMRILRIFTGSTKGIMSP